ncbi:MAG: hypothetical protein OEV93_00460 [Candidatus Moranbacteria bacterium]|nr:hypothetical protein [Candidatus Moranbacteria bacterium]
MKKSRWIQLDPKRLLPIGRNLTKADLLNISNQWKGVYLRLFLENNPDLIFSKHAFAYVKELSKESGRLRKDRRGDFIHPYRVAQMVALFVVWYCEIFDTPLDRRLLDILIAVALLHDAPEDYDGVWGEILKLFGVHISSVVDNLVIRDSEKKKENKWQYFVRVFSDLIAIIVKAADRIHNTKNMAKHIGKTDFFTPKRISDQNKESREFIIPAMQKLIEQMGSESLFAYMLRELEMTIVDSEAILYRYQIAQGRME